MPIHGHYGINTYLQPYNGFLSLKTPIYRDLRSLSDVHETPKYEQVYRSQLNESLQDRQQAVDSVLLSLISSAQRLQLIHQKRCHVKPTTENIASQISDHGWVSMRTDGMIDPGLSTNLPLVSPQYQRYAAAPSVELDGGPICLLYSISLTPWYGRRSKETRHTLLFVSWLALTRKV